MKILKHGDLQLRKFTCHKCGCEFVADMKEYTVKEGGYLKIPDVYSIDCPECGGHVGTSNAPLYSEETCDGLIDSMSVQDMRKYCKLMHEKLCDLRSEYDIYV